MGSVNASIVVAARAVVGIASRPSRSASTVRSSLEFRLPVAIEAGDVAQQRQPVVSLDRVKRLVVRSMGNRTGGVAVNVGQLLVDGVACGGLANRAAALFSIMRRAHERHVHRSCLKCPDPR